MNKTIKYIALILAVGCGGGGGGTSFDSQDFNGRWLINLSLVRPDHPDPDCGGRVPPPPESVNVQQAGVERGDAVVAELDNGVTLPGDVRANEIATGVTIRVVERCSRLGDTAIIQRGDEVLVFRMFESDGDSAKVLYNFANLCDLENRCIATYEGTAIRQ